MIGVIDEEASGAEVVCRSVACFSSECVLY